MCFRIANAATALRLDSYGPRALANHYGSHRRGGLDVLNAAIVLGSTHTANARWPTVSGRTGGVGWMCFRIANAATVLGSTHTAHARWPTITGRTGGAGWDVLSDCQRRDGARLD